MDNAILVARDLERGLATLHEKFRTVHGDIKPENMMIRFDKRKKRAVGILIDLSSIRKIVFKRSSHGNVLPHLTERIIYTPDYLSPELRKLEPWNDFSTKK